MYLYALYNAQSNFFLDMTSKFPVISLVTIFNKSPIFCLIASFIYAKHDDSNLQ